MKFASMTKGWAIGSLEFKKALVIEHKEVAQALKQNQSEWLEVKQAMLEDVLTGLLGKLGRSREDLKRDGKSTQWKLALAAAMKAQTVATNRWLGENLHMGNLYEVSRKVNAWLEGEPDRNLLKKLRLTPNTKA